MEKFRFNIKIHAMKKTFTLIALIASMSSLLAQDFMMQGFYWNYPRQTGILRYAQVLNSKVDEMSDAGFTFPNIQTRWRISGIPN